MSAERRRLDAIWPHRHEPSGGGRCRCGELVGFPAGHPLARHTLQDEDVDDVEHDALALHRVQARHAVSYGEAGHSWGERLYVVTFDDGTTTEPIPDPSCYGNLHIG